jgi:hypothetical protein
VASPRIAMGGYPPGHEEAASGAYVRWLAGPCGGEGYSVRTPREIVVRNCGSTPFPGAEPLDGGGEYVTRPDFPQPIQQLAAGRVWRRKDVERWAGSVPPHPPRPASEVGVIDVRHPHRPSSPASRNVFESPNSKLAAIERPPIPISATPPLVASMSAPPPSCPSGRSPAVIDRAVLPTRPRIHRGSDWDGASCTTRVELPGPRR